MVEYSSCKSFKKKKITDFLSKYGSSNALQLSKTERTKLCSNDDFNDLAEQFEERINEKKVPIMISQVGGFYVMASLAGIAAYKHTNKKPILLFFDRKNNNIQNAMYNTLLTMISESKERYITNLFGLTDSQIYKALVPDLFMQYVENIIAEEEDLSKMTKKEKETFVKSYYKKKKKYIDQKVRDKYITRETTNQILSSSFNISKILAFIKKRKYDPKRHLSVLEASSKGKLNKELSTLFDTLKQNMIDYLAKGTNYNDLVEYLVSDMKKNSKHHILCNSYIFNSFKSLINKRWESSIKFVNDIDISTEAGVKKLESILKEEGLITDNSTEFEIDLAFLPHIDTLRDSFQFIKRHVQYYAKVNRDKNVFVLDSTASLNIRDYRSIGASFIEEERKKRVPLTNLYRIERNKGFPKLAFLAGANIGNIYNSEVDLQNMIDMVVADKVDTIYIQGLFYSTYYHNQTSRRMLSDPKYETLDQRLKAARKLIKKLNDNGIKVVYQMGVEEYHLYEDMFRIYTREQGVTGGNFLEREDGRSRFDWVRPLIIQQLIPYLIRRGEDVTNFYTDEANETRITELCNAIKNYNEGLPLGDLARYIKPEFLTDTDMFKVVYSSIDRYDELDPAISVNLLSNPSYSKDAQYSQPAAGLIKNLRIHQTGAVKIFEQGGIPQLNVDGSKAFMSIAYKGREVVLNVPQMINDGYYIEHPELLTGIKESIAGDPTRKRVTLPGKFPSYPGGWEITGDAREIMTIVPYYKRVREVMEYVQKTGVPLEEHAVLYFNDIQAGSLTERLEYTLKMMDLAMYNYHIDGIIGNGDFQHGWNYSSFANETRYLGTMSASEQMIDLVELLKPWFRESFGIVKPDVFVDEEKHIDKLISYEIIDHLRDHDLINIRQGTFGNSDTVKKEIDYSTVDLQLPDHLKPFEPTIREKLSNIINLEFFHLVEGNHEYNSDWDKKGFNLTQHLNQELSLIRDVAGSDAEIQFTEYIVNAQGDILQAPFGCKTINGYNIVYSHLFKQATGETPTIGMAKYLDNVGENTYRVDIAIMSHLHVFETSVMNNILLSVTGSSAGQSGYEQAYGYQSRPLFVIHRFLPDGRLVINTIGAKFLDNYEIQNPYVKEIGLDKYIEQCLTHQATVFSFDEVNNPQPIHQRQLKIGKPTKIIGPKID